MLKHLSKRLFGAHPRRRVARSVSMADTLEVRQMLSGTSLTIAGIYEAMGNTQSGATSNVATTQANSNNGTVQSDDTISGAKNLGVLRPGFGNARAADNVGYNGDMRDFFKFEVDGTASNVRIALTSLSQDLDIRLRNANGTVVAWSVNTGKKSELITLSSLSAGTYYLEVYQGVSNAKSSYALEITSKITPNIQRRDFTFSGTLRTYSQQIGTTNSGNEHWYRITVPANRRVDIQLYGMTRDLDLEIRNGSTTESRVIASSRQSGTNMDRITTTLSAGTYWVRVYPYTAGATNYSLHLNLSGRVA